MDGTVPGPRAGRAGPSGTGEDVTVWMARSKGNGAQRPWREGEGPAESGRVVFFQVPGKHSNETIWTRFPRALSCGWVELGPRRASVEGYRGEEQGAPEGRSRLKRPLETASRVRLGT